MFDLSSYRKSIHQKLKDPCSVTAFRKYDLDEGGIYLAGINDEGEICAEALYSRSDPEMVKYSDGFGGRTLTFNLEDGSEIEVQGPWHSNADSFFYSTGIDLRDKHWTAVLLTGEDIWNKGELPEEEILYKEDSPRLGTYHRGLRIAEKYFRDHPEEDLVCLNHYTSGGASISCFSEWEHIRDQIDYWERIGEIV